LVIEDEDEDQDEDEALTESGAALAPTTLIVSSTHDGSRLDHFLRDALPSRSRALLQKHIECGAVLVGGTSPKRGARSSVHTGDVVSYRPPAPVALTLEPEDIPLSILFEDEHLVVVDKPRDLVVHPALGHPSGPLVNALLHHFGRGPFSTTAALPRPGIVHRLDRDTTGAIVVAKNEQVHDALGKSFADRKVEKRYIAITHGVPKPPTQTLDTLYGRHPRDRKKFSSKVSRGKRALTQFRVAEPFWGAALLEVDLFTGRTHQIRVHLADLGHPLVGDTTYGRKSDVRDPRTGRVIATFNRPALHAARLAFTHPISGAPIDIRAPIPDDMSALLESLRRHGRIEE
jgi:23S rRNA pseudouridine1911/1915/1917 synthase